HLAVDDDGGTSLGRDAWHLDPDRPKTLVEPVGVDRPPWRENQPEGRGAYPDLDVDDGGRCLGLTAVELDVGQPCLDPEVGRNDPVALALLAGEARGELEPVIGAVSRRSVACWGLRSWCHRHSGPLGRLDRRPERPCCAGTRVLEW